MSEQKEGGREVRPISTYVRRRVQQRRGLMDLCMSVCIYDRALSIKSTPVSLVLESTRGKSFLVNLIDTPGMVCMYISVYHNLSPPSS